MTDMNDSMRQGQQGSEGTGPALVPAFVINEVNLKVRPESRVFGQPNGDQMGIEQYRLLHARLLELQTRAPLKRVLVTSAERGEGKTHVATNLSLTMARESNQKVLLIDADTRKPEVHKVLGIANDYGLTDILRNGSDAGKLLNRVTGTNLYILTAGSLIGQPFTTASVPFLKMVLDQINSVFDWVIIDSPPALAAADVALLSKVTDGALLVVRGYKTPRDLVERAKQMLGASLLGAVLNGVALMKSYSNSNGVPSSGRGKA